MLSSGHRGRKAAVFIGASDITEKKLLRCNDVFADVLNGILFGGDLVIREEELEEQDPRASYMADGVLGETERDVVKRWKNGNVRLACIGVENQTEPDGDMSLRVLGYDGAEYRAQLRNGQKDRYPVVTVVLYFGFKRRWNKPTSLLETVHVPERLRPYVNDYRVNLIEVAYLEPEQVERFQSDFRIVADFFVQQRICHEKRKQGIQAEYVPSRQVLTHVEETLNLLAAVTRDERYESVLQNVPRGGSVNMCEILDEAIRKGITKGIEQGIEQGREQGIEQGIERGREQGIEQGIERGRENTLLESIRNLRKSMGVSTEQAMQALCIPEQEREHFRSLL